MDSILSGPMTPPPGWPQAHSFFPSSEPIRRDQQNANNDFFEKQRRPGAPIYGSSCYPPFAEEQTEAQSQEVTCRGSPGGCGRTRWGWESAGPQALNAGQAALGRGHSFFLQTFIECLLCARHSSRHDREQKDKIPGLPPSHPRHRHRGRSTFRKHIPACWMGIHSEQNIKQSRGWGMLGCWGRGFKKGVKEGHTDRMTGGMRKSRTGSLGIGGPGESKPFRKSSGTLPTRPRGHLTLPLGPRTREAGR